MDKPKRIETELTTLIESRNGTCGWLNLKDFDLN